MSAYFNTLERIEQLQAAARSWRGTPFAPNSSSKGHGVSCQKLVQHIYAEAGWKEIETPEVPMAHAMFSERSYVMEFMETRPEFERVRSFEVGDLVGIAIGRCIHHLAIVISPGVIVHCWHRLGVVEQPLATITGRVGAIWRPLE